MADPAARAPRQHIYVKREHEIPGRESRPQDGSAPQESHWPLRSGQRTNAIIPNAATVFSGQTIATTFDGVTGPTQTGSFPPDSMGAVGPSQFLIFVNGRLRTFNKTTGHADGALEANPDVFFGSVMTPVPGSGDNFTTDPQVRYDRLSGRWILTVIDVPSSSSNNIGDLPNRILIAVSDAAGAGVISGSTVWTFYFVQQNTVGGFNTGEALDYDSLGVDNNALYVGGNMFDAASGSFVTTSAFVIRKSSVLSGGPIVATAFRGLLSGGDGPDSPRGVDNSDSAATEGYIIGSSDATFGRLVLRRVSNPGGTPTISANIPITVNSTAEPITVDHLGNTGGFNGRLDGLDDRLFAAQIRNHRLWTAHNIAVTSAGVASGSDSQRRNAARWYELDVPVGSGTPTVVQSGTVFDSASTASSARQYWVPSVAVSGQGHAALGFSTAGTSFRVNAATAGRLATDTLGTLSAPTLFTASNSAYNPSGDSGNGNGSRRWGDYSFTSVDPNDDMTMWTVQEFCDGSNTYGMEVAKLIAPPPATPSSTSSSVAGGQSSVNVTIIGTSVSGSGFFDPGTGFDRRIAASVSGGVIVNSVTYGDVTHVTLNLNTVSASAGAQNVTITNPDGQAQTGNGILTVGAGSPSPTPTATPTPTPTPTPSPTPTPTATPSPTPTATPISTVATPVISPNGGSYRRKVFITLNCSTPAATIYYTLDGSTPTTTSQVFQSELKLTSSATLKAKAIKTGYQDSAVATATFVVKRRR
ncbi:MAG TPA: chitobiase/beta-hexosaminidase C-terminal domain-containing protein [Bryobacteraceae bacterium]|nr:chitobiase/beta-hexosaminidase C-terminal domain-containing protein [Bryobacteraceae bacterium]